MNSFAFPGMDVFCVLVQPGVCSRTCSGSKA